MPVSGSANMPAIGGRTCYMPSGRASRMTGSACAPRAIYHSIRFFSLPSMKWRELELTQLTPPAFSEKSDPGRLLTKDDKLSTGCRILDENTIRVVGHRGARGILPENSIVGFDFALSIGVDLLEFDVLLSRDDIPVITHNHEFHGSAVRGADGAFLNGEHPRVASLTMAEIERFDIGRLNADTEYGRRFPDQAQMDGSGCPVWENCCIWSRSRDMQLPA